MPRALGGDGGGKSRVEAKILDLTTTEPARFVLPAERTTGRRPTRPPAAQAGLHHVTDRSTEDREPFPLLQSTDGQGMTCASQVVRHREHPTKGSRMRRNRRRTVSGGVSVTAVAMILVGGAPAALAAGSGATVTDASGPTYLYGSNNPLAGVEFDIHGVQTPSGKTILSLRATGFAADLAGQTFGAHVHVNPCGPTGAAAGPHYINFALPATDVEAREVWLDLTVNADGTATARAKRDWVFNSTAQSVVVHALPTASTGVAGPRLACTDAGFHL